MKLHNYGFAICLILLLLALLFGCTSKSDSPQNFGIRRGGESDGLEYTVLVIEGMTCIYVEYEGGVESHAGYAGLTCNWDEWRLR